MKSGKAVILLSRQPLRPDGHTAWVRQAIKAVHWVREQNLTLVSSLGLQTWELVTSLGTELGVQQDIYIPAADEAEFGGLRTWATEQFALDDERVRFISVLPLGDKEKKDLPVLRDGAVVNAADIIVPVSIRSGGNMDRLISESHAKGKEIMFSLQIKYQRRSSRLKYDIAADALNPNLDDLGGRFLVHWTRASAGPWPDERHIDFWRAVIDSDDYPRSALHTLQHMTSTGRIIASRRHMPGGVATVSFTGLDPREGLPLMRWRARYHEMSFEPYGIAIEKDFACAHGVVPVEYYSSVAGGSKPDYDNWRCQSQGRKTDWRREEEYRCRGNFDLSKIPSGKILLICYRPDEARRLESETGVKTVSILA